jgi:hypothetical protein
MKRLKSWVAYLFLALLTCTVGYWLAHQFSPLQQATLCEIEVWPDSSAGREVRIRVWLQKISPPHQALWAYSSCVPNHEAQAIVQLQDLAASDVLPYTEPLSCTLITHSDKRPEYLTEAVVSGRLDYSKLGWGRNIILRQAKIERVFSTVAYSSDDNNEFSEILKRVTE